MAQDPNKIKLVVRNRRARHDYTVLETIEAGIELKGAEVKSLRDGKVQLADCYATVDDGEVVLHNMHISPYKQAGQQVPDPTRPRRLLLHKKEIRKLIAATQQKGMTLVPLSVYFKGSHAKVELALAIGRKKYDKRQAIAKSEAERKMKQALRTDKERRP